MYHKKKPTKKQQTNIKSTNTHMYQQISTTANEDQDKTNKFQINTYHRYQHKPTNSDKTNK